MYNCYIQRETPATASMRPANITSSTSFRIAGIYVLLFLISFFAANLFAYSLIVSFLYERLDAHAKERFREIEVAFQSRGLDGAIQMIASHGPAIKGQETLYTLRGRDGVMLAGNADLGRVPMGLSTLEAGEMYATNFRIFRQRLGEGELITGVSYDDTDRLRQIALISLGWATAIVLVSGLGSGAVLAFKTRRRIADLSAVMRKIGSGELAKRLPISSRKDDIDTLAMAVNVALAHLESSVAAMKQVTTDVAHDLKTPIARLLLTLEAAHDAGTLEDARTLILTAIDELEKITSTFDALLRISQIEAGARRDRFNLVDVGALVKDVAEVYADIVDDQSRHLSIVFGDSLERAFVYGDADLLKQLLANLVLNAIRHTQFDSQIELHITGNHREIKLVVSDNGPGIPPAERLNVFKRFYRLDKSRTTEGSGLGLSLVKAITDLHGASIKLHDNQPGLRVVVAFPRTGLETHPDRRTSSRDQSRILRVANSP